MKIASLLGIVVAAGLTCSAGAQVVISQFYGGGGNAGAPFNQDFIELHNNGSAPVDISGWSVQYGSATGVIGSSASFVTSIPASTVIPAGGYYLIGEAFGTNTGFPSLPTPDVNGTIAMSATAAKVALVSDSVPLAGNCAAASVVDLVGIGTTATCFEGAGAAPGLGNTIAALRGGDGCNDTNNNSLDFATGAPNPRNSGSPLWLCGTFVDCNNNGVNDPIDIANGTSQDCNHNGIPDECDIASGLAADCNGNGIPDSCDIASGVATDVNSNGIPDSCEDCNGNGIPDGLDLVSGFSQDCNANGVPDECDLLTGRLTDVNHNGIADACEGAAVLLVNQNATVLPVGVRSGPNGDAFMNVEGSGAGTNASYAGMRWDLSALAAAFDAQFGAGNWAVDSATLQLMQSNAAFTFDGGVELFYTPTDTVNLANGNTTTLYANFDTDFATRDSITSYLFMQGTINTNGSGTIELYSLGDTSGSNNTAQDSIMAELNSGAGQLTLLARETDTLVAATYAGKTNFSWRGPQIVVFGHSLGGGGCSPTCDYNQDGGADTSDVIDLANDIASGSESFPGSCSDYNQDGGADTSDVIDLANAIASGSC